MRRPRSVDVLGKTYEIIYCPEKEMKDLSGYVVPEEKIIKILNNMSEEDTHSTILHEIIHVILVNSGISFLFSEEMDEAITRALENGLAPLVTLKFAPKKRKRQ